MKLIKEEIGCVCLMASKNAEFTIDEHFNVPDTMEDVEKVISTIGNVAIEEAISMPGKVKLKGVVNFKFLYQTQSDSVDFLCYENEIPFEENITVDAVTEKDKVDVSCNLEDIYVTIVNSRKFEVRGLACAELWICSKTVADGAIDVLDGEDEDVLYKECCYTNTCALIKDVVKLKEDILIPSGKPDIGKLLWWTVSMYEPMCRVSQEGVVVSGQLEICILYKVDGEDAIQYANLTREFKETIEVNDLTEDMVLCDIITLGKSDIYVKENEDGEDRIVSTECNLNLDLKVYQDKCMNFIQDIYSPSKEIELVEKELCSETLLMKNNARTRVADRIEVEEDKPNLLQVINQTGNVWIDEVKPFEGGLVVSGVIRAQVMYISEMDDSPLVLVEKDIPFEYKAEANILDNQTSIRISPMLENLSAHMVSRTEIEIKAAVALNISVFRQNKLCVITDVKTYPIDMAKKASLPGIIGYVVKDGDTIWSLAKKYYSSVNLIKEINDLNEDEIASGDKIVIVKK